MADELTGNISGTKLFVLGTASIVGPWLMLTAQWIGYTGVSVCLAFIACGLLCLPIGLCYGELAGLFKNKGGSYEYVRSAFNRDTGYWISWTTMFTYVSLIVFQLVCVATIVGYAGNLDISGVTLYAFVIFLMVLMTLLNSRNIEIAGSLQMVLFVVLVVSGVVSVVSFVTNGNWDLSNMGDFLQQGLISRNEVMGIDTGLLMAIAALVTMFFGFELIPQFAGESSYPVNKYWRLMLGGIIFVIIFDSLICFAEAGMAPFDYYETGATYANSYDLIQHLYSDPGGFVGAVFADQYVGSWLSWTLIIGNVCCMFCCLIGFWLGGSRILYSMGCAGSLPRFFGKTNKSGVPSWGNYFVLILVFILTMIALSGDKWINATFSLMALGCGFTYFGVSVAFLKLKKSRPDLERPWTAPAGTVVGIIASCSAAFMTIMMIYTIISSALNDDPTMLLMTVVFFAIVGVIFAYLKKDQKAHPENYDEEPLLPPKEEA